MTLPKYFVFSYDIRENVLKMPVHKICYKKKIKK